MRHPDELAERYGVDLPDPENPHQDEELPDQDWSLQDVFPMLHNDFGDESE